MTDEMNINIDIKLNIRTIFQTDSLFYAFSRTYLMLYSCTCSQKVRTRISIVRSTLDCQSKCTSMYVYGDFLRSQTTCPPTTTALGIVQLLLHIISIGAWSFAAHSIHHDRNSWSNRTCAVTTCSTVSILHIVCECFISRCWPTG